MPWGSPARAPLATHVALQRAFMLVSSPRIHGTAVHLRLQLYQLRFISKVWLPSRARSASVKYKSDQALKRRVIKSLISLCSYQSPLWCFIGVKIFFSFGPSGRGPTLSCERELACSCFASPQYTIPVLPSSPSALSTSGGPLLFVTWWPKWSGGTEDHFGCKWLPWGSPVRAPLATPVALPRAFMLISIPRIRVQLCTTANNCTNSDFTPKTTRRCSRRLNS